MSITERLTAIAVEIAGTHHLEAHKLFVIVNEITVDRPSPAQDTPGLHRGDHPDTSVEAAYRPELKTGTQRQRILDWLIKAYKAGTGFTDEELQRLTGIVPNAERPRRVELVGMRYVRDGGTTRKTEAGLDAIVWVYIDEPLNLF